VTVSAARPYHHGNLRSELLDSAERTLRERGVGGLSLRELAREAGVSHGAPRRHFPDKQSLLDALAEDGFDRLGGELAAAVAGAAPGFDTRLVALAHAYVSFATDRAALLELMFAGKHRPGATASLREAADRAFAAPLDLIREGQAQGDVVDGDPKSIAVVAFATLQGLAALFNSGMVEDAALDELVDHAVERLLLGLRPR
jgi:AcrR family transcriptional regulator